MSDEDAPPEEVPKEEEPTPEPRKSAGSARVSQASQGKAQRSSVKIVVEPRKSGTSNRQSTSSAQTPSKRKKCTCCPPPAKKDGKAKSASDIGKTTQAFLFEEDQDYCEPYMEELCIEFNGENGGMQAVRCDSKPEMPWDFILINRNIQIQKPLEKNDYHCPC